MGVYKEATCRYYRRVWPLLCHCKISNGSSKVYTLCGPTTSDNHHCTGVVYRIVGGVQFSWKGNLHCSAHNTRLTPPLTACAHQLKPAEKLVKDRLIEYGRAATIVHYTSSCIGMIVFCTYTLRALEDLASTGDTVMRWMKGRIVRGWSSSLMQWSEDWQLKPVALGLISSTCGIFTFFKLPHT